MSEVLSSEQKEKMMNDLRAVISDAEDLLRLGADQAGEAAVEWRARVQARLKQARGKLHDVQEATVAKAKAAGHVTDDYVHGNPWKSISVAAGVGLLLGLLITRR
jgi:ElaB/YqjD/DUF883 family membrane-anchored ribosome-binding protein